MSTAAATSGGPVAAVAPLAPAAVAAKAYAAPWGWACGRRMLWLLAAGLVWWLAALAEPRWIVLAPAWEAAVLAAWVLDLRRLPVPAGLTVERNWLGPAHLGGARLGWRIRNRASRGVAVWLADELPPGLTSGAAAGVVQGRWLAAGSQLAVEAEFQPQDLGGAPCGQPYLRYQSAWGLAERRARAPLAQSVRVYPDLEAARRDAAALSLTHPRLAALLRNARQKGRGREFESLRAFREGDEPRDIFWPATARTGRTMVKVRQAERGEPVWLVLDCGRLMRARERGGEPRRLGRAATAALTLASAALAASDKVGLLAYGAGIQCRLPPAGGAGQARAVLEALAGLEAERGEADHYRAAAALLAAQPRRAMVIWLTELAESGLMPEVVEAGAQISRRHCLLLAVPRVAALAAAATAIPASPREMYLAAAALELAVRRQETLARLRAQGARAIELGRETMAATLVRQYLEIKLSGRL